MRAFNSGDAQGASEIYDPDGYLFSDLLSILLISVLLSMPNGCTPVKGRNGIEKFFKRDIADGVKSAQVFNT